jgi:hypothetical protein
MRLNRVLGAITAAALAGALAGCSGDASPAADSPAQSPAASGTTPTSTPAASTPVDDPTPSSSADEEPPTGEGYDAKQLLAAMKAAVRKNESTHLTLAVGGGGRSMTGEGDVSYAGDTTVMQMTLRAPQLSDGTLEMRLVDGVMYLAMPPMTPKGKFVELDTSNPNGPFGDLGSLFQGDPLATFDAFDAGLKKVRYVGPETVDGEDMDHYVLTVDGKAAARAQGITTGMPVPKTVTYDLWLDHDDLMRRVQYSVQGGRILLTMSDWGEPVTVKAPPRSAVMQLPGG